MAKARTNDVSEMFCLLHKSQNIGSACFQLTNRPIVCCQEFVGFDKSLLIMLCVFCRIVRAMERTIAQTRRLKALRLGCLSDLTDRADQLLPVVVQHHSRSLEALHLCSVKENPDAYGLICVPEECFAHLINLQQLGLDYDYITNSLLLNFCNNNRRMNLQKLVIHVHGLEPERERVTNSTWRYVATANPSLRVTLNLIHSLDGAVDMLTILQPAMPLEKLRMFFCQHINFAAINFISQHMSKFFTSLHIIDGLETEQVCFVGSSLI